MPPSIRPDPPDGNYVVKKGRKVELRCVASGNPDPTITWTRVVSECLSEEEESQRFGFNKSYTLSAPYS